MWRIAQYLAHSGSYPAARDLFQLIARAYANDDAYGPEHQKTLAARSNLALNTGEAGDAGGARDQYVVLLPVQDRVLGAEHPDTLTTRGHLASFTGMAGDVAGPRTSSPRCFPSARGPWAPNTQTP